MPAACLRVKMLVGEMIRNKEDLRVCHQEGGGGGTVKRGRKEEGGRMRALAEGRKKGGDDVSVGGRGRIGKWEQEKGRTG